MAAKVKAQPDGFSTLSAHIIVDQPEKAINFYKKAFGAEEIMRMPGPDGKGVMHAELKIGDSTLMMCGENPAWGCKSPKTLGGTPITLHLYVNDADKSFKQAIAAGAKEKMPVQDMFWGDRYGQVTDPFGFVWSVATHIKDVTPEECMEGMKKAFAGGACA